MPRRRTSPRKLGEEARPEILPASRLIAAALKEATQPALKDALLARRGKATPAPTAGTSI